MNPFFFEIHSELDREGPGDFEDTQRAWQSLPAEIHHPQILDLGCGPGAQTLDLIKLTDGKIISVDFHEPFIQRLKKRVNSLGLSHRIDPRVGDMFQLDFLPNTFDIIWCEGALYFLGVEQGLEKLSSLLTPRGCVAFTDAVWLKPNPPPAVVANWAECPLMTTVEENLLLFKKTNFKLLSHFSLSARAWENYYTPLENRVRRLKSLYHQDSEKLKLLNETQQEIDVYREYSEYFGYEFFVIESK